VTSTSLSRAHARAAARICLAVGVLTAVTAGVVDHVTDETAVADAPRAGLSAQPLVLAEEPGSPARPALQAAAVVRRANAAEAARVAAARKQAEEARKQAAAARAKAEASRAALRDPRTAARLQLAEHGWSSAQFSCLDSLWTKESGWNPAARNPSSGAFGIAQALPAGKMASAGADWRTNPVTQIRWGLRYIDDVYGSPCGAWAHSRATNWY
jgi:murein DD-endopeptidase MepM/ murein hydrolase activator NlpD